MKLTAMNPAIAAGMSMQPRADGREPNHPHIEPVMRLRPRNAAATEYELLIYGTIGESWFNESVTAQSVVQQLNELDDKVDTINVRINSYGGSVADGMAIYNALSLHPATKSVTVDGVAMSAASLIAMAGDTVEMPQTSMLMIHAPWGGILGNAKEMRKYAESLDKFSDAMAGAYAAKCGQSRAAMLALLSDGDDHYYTAEEAAAEGFADLILADDTDSNTQPDDQSRDFAAQLLDRISSAGCKSSKAGLAIAAALRSPYPGDAARSQATATPCALKTAPGAPPIGAQANAGAQNPNPPAEPAGNTTPADAGNNSSGDTEMTEEQKQAAAKAALAADKERRAAIRAQFAPFRSRADLDQAAVAALQGECEDNTELTADSASHKLLALLGQNTTPSASQRVEAGSLDETVTYREGAAHAVLHRVNPAAHPLDEKSKGFRGMNLGDMARDSLERTGKQTRGMSRNEIAVQALQTTSDFPNILENVVSKTLRQGYEGASRSFVPFSRQATLPDFKQISRAQLGGAPNLKRVLEGAEYEHGTIGDGAEKYQVQKYGRIVAISWETIINDDLDALSRIPQAFGASAAELESDIVYAILTGNPDMADGTALFHSNHGNLGTAADLADALDPTAANPLAEMRKLMLLQKGLEGQYITVRPRFLIVPPSLEEAALKITSANFVASKGADQNVYGPSLVPVTEPRLEDSSSTAWFAAALPNNIDTIEYAYLEGNEAVFTETKAGFEVDGMQVKCRHVFGAKAIDHRGLFKNAGA